MHNALSPKIAIEVGSGIAAADEVMLATRNPKRFISMLGALLPRDCKKRKLESLSQSPPRTPRDDELLLLVRSKELSSHSLTFPLSPITP
jgi:hypothetical protein